MGTVKTLTRTNQVLRRLRHLMKTVHVEIRQRAYQLFQEKGSHPGYELEDWLEAERQVLWSPNAELVETADEVLIAAEVDGFDAQNLQVDLLPDSITIEGAMPAAETPHGKRLLRQFDLPARIIPDDAAAALNDGVLRIVARKQPAAARTAGDAAKARVAAA